MSDDLAVEWTRRWVTQVVIGLNLCPFAAAPFGRDAIAYRVCPADTMDAVYAAFLNLLQTLVDTDERQAETALLIVTGALGDFDDYLDAVALCEQAVVEAGLDGVIQVASFHPDYRFADVSADDPANYTNRSPYPMFHLIREQGLEAAIASYPAVDQIPTRNVERLRELGIEGIQAILRDLS